MNRYLDFLLPDEDRSLPMWLALGVGIFTLITWLGVPLWRDAVTAISPSTSADEATRGTLAFGLLLLEFVLVYFGVFFARRQGAPRWLWLPIAALGAWVALAELVVYAIGLVPAAASTSATEVITSLVIGISPLFVIALPALLACMRTGDDTEPLLGDYAIQPRLFAGAALVVAAVGLPWEGLSNGWLGGLSGASISLFGVPLTGTLIIWAFIVPAVACWLATWRFHLQRAAWLPVAVGGLGVLLSALAPEAWLEGFASWLPMVGLGIVIAVLTAGGAILGAWFGTREHAESDMAGYIQG